MSPVSNELVVKCCVIKDFCVCGTDCAGPCPQHGHWGLLASALADLLTAVYVYRRIRARIQQDPSLCHRCTNRGKHVRGAMELMFCKVLQGTPSEVLNKTRGSKAPPAQPPAADGYNKVLGGGSRAQRSSSAPSSGRTQTRMDRNGESCAGAFG